MNQCNYQLKWSFLNLINFTCQLLFINMSYPEVGIDGEVNPCYFFMREVENCYHNNLYPATNCKNEQSDFFECHKRGKQVKLMNQLQHQLRRAKVINVPHYDAQNDRFVFDDGKIVSNSDPIFNRFKWA